MEKIKKNKPNVSADKREFMLLRETLKVLLIIGITTLFWLLLYFKLDYNIKPKTKIIKINHIVKKVDKTNYNDLKVVIKTSKDIRKYFVSYKKYLTKNNYQIIIKEISFNEYMSISTNDTLNTENFNLK